ncbi:uncharacterized protein LOC120352924 [Nilaparvata lugens]|uniref:uncharacterized protein LOC120352924 n=1 Tax=Nilaparvata lugens TaxID=108931 RepID=UPI00193CA9B1|nr:uncharacterized protein LOC120352924 [Nilaparvata lugens]
MMTSVIEESLFIDKACRINLNISANICDHISSKENGSFKKKCSCVRKPMTFKKEFPIKDQSNMKLINIDGGDNLVIGSKPTQTVAQPNSSYICTKFGYDQISYEKSNHKTVVKKAGIDDDSYFVLITRAVWLCKEDVVIEETSQLSHFVRVENDLISIKPIAAVEFYDGVFVSATRYVGQRYAVKIKEIKYLQSTSTDLNKYETAPMNVVQYDGLIAFEKALFPPYQPG